MKKDKFLTVFAVFDENTQEILREYQEQILSLGYKGTQSMDIPFHISLGTYSIDKQETIKEKIIEICKSNKTFNLELNKINRFGYKVLFIEPKINNDLLNLHKLFDSNYLSEKLPWHPHTTIFMGERRQIKETEKCLTQIFKPISAKIVGIQMAEFFPTRMIIQETLKN